MKRRGRLGVHPALRHQPAPPHPPALRRLGTDRRQHRDLLRRRGGGTGERADQASVIAFGLIPAVFNHLVDARRHWRSARLADAHHLRLPPRRLLAPRRQHDLPVGVRRQRRGRARPLPLLRLLPALRGRRRLRLRPLRPDLAGAGDRRLGRDRRHRRRLFHPPPYAKIWILAFGRIPLRLSALWVLGFWIVFQVFGVLVAAAATSPGGRISAASSPGPCSSSSCAGPGCRCSTAPRPCRPPSRRAARRPATRR